MTPGTPAKSQRESDGAGHRLGTMGQRGGQSAVTPAPVRGRGLEMVRARPGDREGFHQPMARKQD